MNELRKEFAKKFPEINKTIFKVRQLAQIMPISDDDLEYYELLNWFQQKLIEARIDENRYWLDRVNNFHFEGLPYPSGQFENRIKELREKKGK